MQEQLIRELVDTVMRAIEPAMIRREWIESFIRRVVEKYSIS